MLDPNVMQRLRETMAQPDVMSAYVINGQIYPRRDATSEPAPRPEPSEGILSFYVVYNHPSDFPEGWVARRNDFDMNIKEIRMTSDIYVADTLEECRAILPRGLTNIGRQPEDDPKIYEVWI